MVFFLFSLTLLLKTCSFCIKYSIEFLFGRESTPEKSLLLQSIVLFHLNKVINPQNTSMKNKKANPKHDAAR
jgi:hypothetical protein